MIPRYHGRWSITTKDGQRMTALLRWDSTHHHYHVITNEAASALKSQPTSFGRNGIRRWLKEVKAEPVDGQQPVA